MIPSSSILCFLLVVLFANHGATTLLDELELIKYFRSFILQQYPTIASADIRSIKLAMLYMNALLLPSGNYSNVNDGTIGLWSPQTDSNNEISPLLYFEKVYKLSEIADDERIHTVCTLGFEKGVTALNFLISNPSARLISLDSFKHPYVSTTVNQLMNLFPNREILVIAGDSRRTINNLRNLLHESGSLCNLVFVEGNMDMNTTQLASDIVAMKSLLDPTFHRFVIDNIDVPHITTLWQSLVVDNSLTDGFVPIEVIHSPTYPCISWQKSTPSAAVHAVGENEVSNILGFSYAFDFHEQDCPSSLRGSLGIGEFRLHSLPINPSHHQPPKHSVVDPKSLFLMKDEEIILINGKHIAVDDILYGYDVLFEERQMYLETRWLGVLNMQDPTDSIKIAEYIWDAQPEAIIELGTNNGGGALFYATIVDVYSSDVPIVTIDPVHYHNGTKCTLANTSQCAKPDQYDHWKRHVHFIQGYPVKVLDQVQRIIGKRTNVLVIEDSLHKYDMVLENIEMYHRFVPVGGIMLVQDTKMDRFYSEPGPYAAIQTFRQNHPDFVPDRSFENLLYTQHPCGWLRRMGSVHTL